MWRKSYSRVCILCASFLPEIGFALSGAFLDVQFLVSSRRGLTRVKFSQKSATGFGSQLCHDLGLNFEIFRTMWKIRTLKNIENHGFWRRKKSFSADLFWHCSNENQFVKFESVWFLDAFGEIAKWAKLFLGSIKSDLLALSNSTQLFFKNHFK